MSELENESVETKELSKTKKLLVQIIKFGFVGGTSFIIDFLITMLVSALLRGMGMSIEDAAAVGAIFGFVISLIYNYLMSMRFVFERRDDMDRKKEFLIFTVLSMIGLGINELVMYFGLILCNNMMASFTQENPNLATAGVKIVATAIVMVYNFISRKMTLEKKD